MNRCLSPILEVRPEPRSDLLGVLTLGEVAQELRCSKAHVCNIINGKVSNTTPLPVIHLGRRRVVRRSSLEEWIKASEQPPT